MQRKTLHPSALQIENALGAAAVGTYPSGHMGATILRLRRISDGQALVAKFSFARNRDAIADIKANIAGFRALASMGAGMLVPPEFSMRRINGRAVLVMRDLGMSIRFTRNATRDYRLLAKSFGEAIGQTRIADPDGMQLKRGLREIREKLDKYLHAILPPKVRECILPGLEGITLEPPAFVGLMLLDFTPDNVFVDAAGIRFIDPWRQRTYYGHPAVSIGQFVTLARDVYALPGSKAGGKLLERFAIRRIPSLIRGDAKTAGRAFKLGSALQFTLSSYVRVKRNPPLAREYRNRAIAIIESLLA